MFSECSETAAVPLQKAVTFALKMVVKLKNKRNITVNQSKGKTMVVEV